MKSKKYTQEQLIQAVRTSHSYAETCRNLGISDKGRNNETIKNQIKELGLDISHFTGQRWNKGQTAQINPAIRGYKKAEKYLIYNDPSKPFINSYKLKDKLLKEGIKEYKCERCGISDWLGQPIILQLHHINGLRWDNRIENLQMLCPNCHSQTDNYSGRKLSALEETLEAEPRKFEENLTDNADVNFEPTSSVEEKCVETRHEEPKSKKHKELEPKYCAYCGKILEGKSRKNKYCSQECAHKANGSKRPDVFELLNAFKEYKSFLQVGRHYGVSDNAVRKWCNLYGILDKVKAQSRLQTTV